MQKANQSIPSRVSTPRPPNSQLPAPTASRFLPSRLDHSIRRRSHRRHGVAPLGRAEFRGGHREARRAHARSFLGSTQAFTTAPAQKDETQALRERVAELERSEARANEKMQMLEEELHAALDAGGGTTTTSCRQKTPMLTLPAATPSLQTPDANTTTTTTTTTSEEMPPAIEQALREAIEQSAAAAQRAGDMSEELMRARAEAAPRCRELKPLKRRCKARSSNDQCRASGGSSGEELNAAQAAQWAAEEAKADAEEAMEEARAEAAAAKAKMSAAEEDAAAARQRWRR